MIWTYEASDWFNSVAIAANGSLAVAGTEYDDRTVYVWKPGEKNPCWRWHIDPSEDIRVNAVSISSDGSYFVVGTRYRVHLFKSDEFTPIWTYPAKVDIGASDIRVVAISPDGSYFTAASNDGCIYLFKNEEADSYVEWSCRLSDFWEARSVDISENGRFLAAACENELNYFSRAENQPQWTRSTGRYVWSVSVSRDGSRVAAGGEDMKVYLFDETGQELMSPSVGDVVWSVSISPDGTLVAAGSNNGLVTLFDGTTGNRLWSSDAPEKSVACVSISENKSHVVAGSDDDHVYLYRIDEGTPIWTYKTAETIGSVESVSISENGCYVVAAPSKGVDRTFYLMATGKPPPGPFPFPLWMLVAIIAVAFGVAGLMIKRRITPKVK